MALVATEQVAKIFRHFDADNSGTLSREEVAAVLRRLAPSQWKDDSTIFALLAAVDVNHDGLVQYEEFVAWLCAEEHDDPAGLLAKSRLQVASSMGGRGKKRPKKPEPAVDMTLEERARNLGGSLEDRDNTDVVRKAVHRKGKLLQVASERLRDDYETVLLAANQYPAAFQWASNRLRADPAMVKAVIAKHGTLLTYASVEIQDDPDLVRLAVTQEPSSIACASERLKNDRDLVLLAIKGSRFTFRYAGMELRDDKDAVLGAMSLGASFEFVSDRLKDDTDVARAALSKNAFAAFKHLPERLKQDRDLLALAYAQSPELTHSYGPESLRDDFELMGLVLNKKPEYLRYMSGRVRSSPELLRTAVQKDHTCIRYAKGEAQDDLEVVTPAVSNDPLLLQYASGRVRDLSEVVLPVLSANGLALQFASNRLQDDDEAVRAAVSNNGLALEFASARLRDDVSIVNVAVANNAHAFTFAHASALQAPELQASLRKLHPWVGADTPVTFWTRGGNKTRLHFPHGVGDGAKALMKTDQSETYTGRMEMRSSSTTHYYVGVLTAVSPPYSTFPMHWQKQVSRVTRHDFDRDGEEHSHDSGWQACEPRATLAMSKINVSSMKVEHPGEAFTIDSDAQKVLDTMQTETDRDKIVFQVMSTAIDTTDLEICLELSTVAGNEFSLSVDKEISVQEVMAKLRDSRHLPVDAQVVLLTQGGRVMNYWDMLLDAISQL